MIKNFKEFMLFESEESQSQEEKGQEEKSSDNKVPTLHIINDIGTDNPDTQWFMTIDIKDIWEQYKSKSLKFEDFAKQYNDRLLGKKTELEQINESCYNDLVEITGQVGEYNEEKSNRYFNRIYDWGDEYGIKIDIGGQPQSQSQQTQPQVQNNNSQ